MRPHNLEVCAACRHRRAVRYARGLRHRRGVRWHERALPLRERIRGVPLTAEVEARALGLHFSECIMAKRARILVIEDDRVIARTVAAALCDEGFDAHVVEGLAAARREIARNAHAAVVLDLDLPDGAGELLLRDLARYDSPPAAIIVSAQDYAPRVASRWGVPHVMKPFDLNELLAAVRVACEARLVPRTFRASLL